MVDHVGRLSHFTVQKPCALHNWGRPFPISNEFQKKKIKSFFISTHFSAVNIKFLLNDCYMLICWLFDLDESRLKKWKISKQLKKMAEKIVDTHADQLSAQNHLTTWYLHDMIKIIFWIFSLSLFHCNQLKENNRPVLVTRLTLRVREEIKRR